MELTELRRQEIAYLLLSKLPEAREALRKDAAEHEGIESGSGLRKGELLDLFERLEKSEMMLSRDSESALALLIYASGTGGETPSTFLGKQVATTCGVDPDEFRTFVQSLKAVQFGEQLGMYRVRDLLGKHVYLVVNSGRWSELGLPDGARGSQPGIGEYALARSRVTGTHNAELYLELEGNPEGSLNRLAVRVSPRDLLTAGGKGYYRTDEDHGPLTAFA